MGRKWIWLLLSNCDGFDAEPYSSRKRAMKAFNNTLEMNEINPSEAEIGEDYASYTGDFWLQMEKKWINPN